jgi:DNA-binding transcriptional ArsR family regulator
VFQALLDRPLSHVAGLARATSMAPPSVRWHLQVLDTAGLVHAERTAREVRFYVSGTVDESTRDPLLALRGPRTAAVLQNVLASPGLSVSELAEGVGASSQSVLRATASLRALGFVEGVRDGKHVRHYAGAGFAPFVARRSSGLPAQFSRVEAALLRAGESVAVARRGRDEVVFQVGRRGARREFRLRPGQALASDPHA